MRKSDLIYAKERQKQLKEYLQHKKNCKDCYYYIGDWCDLIEEHTSEYSEWMACKELLTEEWLKENKKNKYIDGKGKLKDISYRD